MSHFGERVDSGDRKMSRSSKFTIENILGSFLETEKEIDPETRRLMDMIDDTELSDDESIDENEEDNDLTDFESQFYSHRQQIKKEEDHTNPICVRPQPMPNFPPIQPRPTLYSRPPLLPNHLLYPHVPVPTSSSGNLFYTQWLASGSKPPPIFFGLQGIKLFTKKS